VRDRRRAYQGMTRAFAAVFVAVGLLLLVITLANGGGPASVGVLIGVAFLAVGLLRFWLATKAGQ
jgi:hypothetical protein